LRSLTTGNVLPFMAALGLTGMLVGGATWYRRRRTFPQKAREEIERSRDSDCQDNQRLK